MVGRMGSVAEKSNCFGMTVKLGQWLCKHETLELRSKLQDVSRQARRQWKGEECDGALAQSLRVR
jgi:hypothetical protein